MEVFQSSLFKEAVRITTAPIIPHFNPHAGAKCPSVELLWSFLSGLHFPGCFALPSPTAGAE